jgi:regulator of sigma E protease
MLSIVSAIVVIAILIFVHELGHFTFAKLFNVKVLIFSLGFGPAILKKKIGETEYRLSLLPLGGYVKMLGENLDDEHPVELTKEDEERSYANQANWKKLIILIAGPLSNWVFAMFLLWLVFMHGVPYLTTTIGEVMNNSPAYAAGIKKGDTIVQIDNKKVIDWDEMKKIITGNPDKELTLTINRDNQLFVVKVKPEIKIEKDVFGEPVKTPIIGIMPAGDFKVRKSNIFKALALAGEESVDISHLVLVSLVKLIEGKIPTKDLGGPILIAQQAAHQAKRGLSALIYFTALVGINFAILNILPIPVLDGGNVVFTIVEAIIRKPINKKVKLAILQVGVLFIILLTVFAFYNDISRLVIHH